MKRKVVHLAVGAVPGCMSLFALCSDGTVWAIGNMAEQIWEQLPSIPAEESRKSHGAETKEFFESHMGP